MSSGICENIVLVEIVAVVGYFAIAVRDLHLWLPSCTLFQCLVQHSKRRWDAETASILVRVSSEGLP